ncbi:MAG: PTS fructose transporter subunit IIC [Tyzzerella sp.]|uniref:PTS fructose transporter subunit IIC n=1 Tax=Candidatus Fimicola merdigallinarum TaxID=2840819 RepID=A0A9D9H2Q4_9FIRM|nr:PTS fructose transporter subunit IIC [Candidatus Fimicola merdigallinarum]
MSKFLKEAKGHLMTGIGYMLPLIIGSSLVVAIPKLIGVAMGISSLTADHEGFLHILYLLEQVGWTGIGLVNTVLAGFIAFSIGDKPAIGAGLIGGALATSTKAGFLGAVLAAFIAGYVVKWGKKNIHMPESMQQMMPLVIMPFLATGAVALIMGVILAEPLAFINDSLVNWLKDMSNNNTSQLVLAILLGCMIASDMGGPINKSAWMAGNVLMTEGIYQPNVYINCAICIPPLAYAISTVIRKNRFSKSFREAGKSNWVMGFIGITEGAIPFTLVKPTRLVPINMIGGALGAGVACLLGARAEIPPVGGMYGFVSISSGWAYLVGLIVGALFIAIVAPIFVDFNAEDDTKETLTEDDIDIDIQI